ncbi:hypothetical protein [Flavobacterium sp.]|uniref:hypothetical protein n=1 Tax=Flavobacterium sp. TaxID=239 RepID=UPI00121088DB|nr:hypothetical protein [Flavobacterium sp.]RZJ69882.1 MAG: hypothetical protein EOO49_15735 [Flavobacterium sp.]
MERKYSLLTAMFILIALISTSGFYFSYFAKLASLGDFFFVTHLHLFLFFCWFAMLIVQPILVRRRKPELHRKIGRLSYFLAPLIVVSILVLVFNAIPRNYANSPEQAAITAVGGILDVISFSICYVIAMVKKRDLRWHVAFIIGASLIVLNPGLGRLVSNLVNNDAGILAMVVTPFLFAFTILCYEKFKLKRPMLKSPYLAFAFVWICELALFIVLPQTAFWKELIASMAKT